MNVVVSPNEGRGRVHAFGTEKKVQVQRNGQPPKKPESREGPDPELAREVQRSTRNAYQLESCKGQRMEGSSQASAR